MMSSFVQSSCQAVVMSCCNFVSMLLWCQAVLLYYVILLRCFNLRLFCDQASALSYILKSCPENHNSYRSDANNADDVATTTLASDLPTLHPEDQILSPEDLILSLWHVHVILFACATLRWSYLVILAFDQQSTQMITFEFIHQWLTRHKIGHFGSIFLKKVT